MNHLEYLQRLESTGEDERWLVQAQGRGEPHVVWFIRDDDPSHLRAVEQATRAWIGPVHPRVAAIEGVSWHDEYLVVATEDDRGPGYPEAAAQLDDPDHRERWAVAQVIGMADGLATLRQRDRAFVHRRLEPQRMFVDVSGRAKLRAPIPYVEHGPRPPRVGAGTVRGVPHWMSPEQCRGVRVDAASDVFSLASILYFALSGRRPFEGGESFMTVLVAIMESPPPPLATRAPGLQRVLERAFEKDPRRRIPDPGTFAGELWQCVPDAIDYDEVISDRIVAWRASAPDAQRHAFFDGKPCRMRWDQLAPTDRLDVRHCGSCGQDVVRANSLAQVFPLVGHCVAYRGGD